MAEGRTHKEMKERLARALKNHGIPAVMEQEKTVAVDYGRTTKAAIDFVYDIYFETSGYGVALEIDGTVGHTTAQALGQDRHRDRSSKERDFPIITIRFPLNGALSRVLENMPELLLDEIKWQINEAGFDGELIFAKKH